jgi:cation diffusion facilitator family transporter
MSEHDRGHPHAHTHGWLRSRIEALPHFHSHHHDGGQVDHALEASDRGSGALKVSLAILSLTALFQIAIVLSSGSAGLLADGIHNVTDALTAIPLWIAFALTRRPATPRYPYGYGRAEDLAGALIVVVIFLSAVVAGYESAQKFFHPEPLRYPWWIMAAAVIGFVGNESVALLRMRVGREIGSAALIADGRHAQVDGLSSLAVLVGAAGSVLGFPWADPLIGALITSTIVFIVNDAAVTVWRRLMDAVEPEQAQEVEWIAQTVSGVQEVHDVRLRWTGHALRAELHLTVDEDLSTRESHQIAEQARYVLLAARPQLASALIHIDPCDHGGAEPLHPAGDL